MACTCGNTSRCTKMWGSFEIRGKIILIFGSDPVVYFQGHAFRIEGFDILDASYFVVLLVRGGNNFIQ